MYSLYSFSSSDRSEEWLDALLLVWEDSVTGSHDFLEEDEIQDLKPVVRQALKDVPRLFVVAEQTGQTDGRANALGFTGVNGTKIEMLFVRTEFRQKGIGTWLIEQALRQGARQVDVNEQNPEALRFYERFGFEIEGRSDLDAQEKMHPILHLKQRTKLRCRWGTMCEEIPRRFLRWTFGPIALIGLFISAGVVFRLFQILLRMFAPNAALYILIALAVLLYILGGIHFIHEIRFRRTINFETLAFCASAALAIPIIFML